MTQTLVEILLFIPMVLSTGYLLFIADVIQGTMNDMDAAGFKQYMSLLYRRATHSPYTIISGTITFIGIIPYFITYGFGHGWFTAGIVIWFVASAVSKRLNLPVYNQIFALDSGATAQLEDARRRLQRANWIRATLSVVSIALVTIGFF